MSSFGEAGPCMTVSVCLCVCVWLARCVHQRPPTPTPYLVARVSVYERHICVTSANVQPSVSIANAAVRTHSASCCSKRQK
ncbi:hypothetical protein JKP88DRAFT_232142 [Tribonema minus]|uniref:Secreted protein n=1 Tax=Tribonema minus TaxID=303371 RepID=A0A835ZCK9_9STRA|nr:hypothetical protein JKP88DRAFT_232142 [Tribonema minus]